MTRLVANDEIKLRRLDLADYSNRSAIQFSEVDWLKA